MYRTDEKEVVSGSETVQRAAGGGIAVCRGRGMDFGGETEGVAPLRRSAYVGMCESGRDERQAGWHRRRIFTPVPAKEWGQESFFVINPHGE